MKDLELKDRVNWRAVGFYYLIACALSWLFGEATERGKSLLIAVTLHAWFDIVFTFPSTRTYIAVALSTIFWILLLLQWNKDKVETGKAKDNKAVKPR